jgi:hypothetical protein
MVDQCGLPDSTPGNDCNHIDVLVCPCSIEESNILLSTKNTAPVMGNLATDIFLGPSLAGALRVKAAESGEGALFRL